MNQEPAEAGIKTAQATEELVAVEKGRAGLSEPDSPPRQGENTEPSVAIVEPQESNHSDAIASASAKKRPPSEIVVYQDWCKACGICIEFCPTRVLERGKGGYPIVAHPEKCISCDLCELLCPDFAITLTRPAGGDKEE